MKTSKHSTSRKGFGLLVAMLAIVISASASIAYLSYCANTAHAVRRMIDYQKAKLAAETGLEYGIMQLKDTLLSYQFTLTKGTLQDVVDLIPSPPSLGEYRYTTPEGEVAFRIRVDTEPEEGDITQGTACRGQNGEYQYFTVSCGALNTNTGVGAVLRQSLQAVSVYMIRFGVFYENDLEILPGPEMIFTGPVHCNSDMYLDGDSGPLRFYDRVTCHSDIYHRRKETFAIRGDVFIDNASGQQTSMEQGTQIIDSDYEQWMTQALYLWDSRVLSGSHGIPSLDPPINPLDDDHDIIERSIPFGNPSYEAATEGEKFANKAYLVIHVDGMGGVMASNSLGENVTYRLTNAILVVSGSYDGKPLYAKNGDGSYTTLTNGVLDVTQTNFWDAREYCSMAPVDIYVDELLSVFPELHSGTNVSADEGRGIVYVTRDDPDGEYGVIPCVRLRNGTHLPENGLTIASDLPLYVEGDYNTVTPRAPALVAGDAVTFLSKNWQDARSSAALSHRQTVDTTFNTVIMTGNSETIPDDYNGGLENLPRFLEKWSGDTATFEGAIICLWYTEAVSAPWSYGVYYTAPRREWGYDEIYRTAAPPGMPRVFGLEEITWQKSTWGEEEW